ncbi:MAG: glycoside hydrolase family 97 N-terminal domain-containing protein, partial [Bacteroidales bacterium]|nr:glycoside hydrolase family 97 N-terminal domain-containing protein [Bacteroidales bacterium]
MPKSVEAVTSPDGNLEAQFLLYEDGTPAYTLNYDGKAVIKPSKLGYKLIGADDLLKGFTLEGTYYGTIDETWEPVWGEEKEIRNHCNEMLVCLKREDGVAMNVRFRLYNDGLGFRYEFPQENKLTYCKVADEITQFALTGDHTAWWIAGDYDTQEYNYTHSRLSEIRRYNAIER